MSSFSFGVFPPHRAVETNICCRAVWQVWRKSNDGASEVLIRQFTDETDLDDFVAKVENSEMVGV